MTVKPVVDAMALDVNVLSKKKNVKTVPLGYKNRHQTLAQLKAHYNTDTYRIVTEHTILRTPLYMLKQQTTHSCASVDQTLQPSTNTLGLKHRDWTKDKWQIVVWSDESLFIIHHVYCCDRESRLPCEQLFPIVQQDTFSTVVAVLCFGIRSLGPFSGTRGCARTDQVSCRLFEHHCGYAASLHGVSLSNWKRSLPAGLP